TPNAASRHPRSVCNPLVRRELRSMEICRRGPKFWNSEKRRVYENDESLQGEVPTGVSAGLAGEGSKPKLALVFAASLSKASAVLVPNWALSSATLPWLLNLPVLMASFRAARTVSGSAASATATWTPPSPFKFLFHMASPSLATRLALASSAQVQRK